MKQRFVIAAIIIIIIALFGVSKLFYKHTIITHTKEFTGKYTISSKERLKYIKDYIKSSGTDWANTITPVKNAAEDALIKHAGIFEMKPKEQIVLRCVLFEYDN